MPNPWPGECTAQFRGPNPAASPYRYSLTCRWSEGPLLVVVGINPSTASPKAGPDATCKRWLKVAQRWGFGAITVLNLWPLRATSFEHFLKGWFIIRGHDPVYGLHHEPVDGLDRAHLHRAALDAVSEAELILCSWGSGVDRCPSSSIVRQVIEASDTPKAALAYTRDGHPVHPLARTKGLRLKDAQPIEWPRPDGREPRVLSTPKRPVQLGLMETT